MWKRIALIPFGLLLAVIGLEVVLQAASWLAQARVRAGQPGLFGSGDVRVLCLGDSNTYGLYLERWESYPAQLETLWNATHDAPTLEVLNLGMPGTHSSWLVRESERLLDTFEPDLVLLMVGANDFWIQPVPLDDSDARAGGWLRRSRLVRALYMLRKAREADEPEFVDRQGRTRLREPLPVDQRRPAGGGDFELRYGGEAFALNVEVAIEGEGGDAASLRRNLATLTERVRARGAQVVLMTYPSRRSLYHAANQQLRAVAAELGVPLVDHDPLFAPRCPDEQCPDLLFDDGHPKAHGYHVMAEAIAAWLSGSPWAAPR